MKQLWLPRTNPKLHVIAYRFFLTFIFHSSLVIIRCYLGTKKFLLPFFFYRMIRRYLWYCFTRGSCGHSGAEFVNVGPSWELHDKVMELFNVLLLFLRWKTDILRLMQLSTQSFIADTWVVTRSSFTERFSGGCVYCSLRISQMHPFYTFWKILLFFICRLPV